MQLEAARGVRLKNLFPGSCSSASSCCWFDFVPWPVRFGILAAFFYSPGWVQVETSPRRRSRQQCRLDRCGRPFPFFRGALVPRRFEAAKVSSTPLLCAGCYPGSVRRSEPPLFLTLRRIHCERSRQGPTKFPRVGTIVRLRQAVFAVRQVGSTKRPLKAALRHHSF